MNASKLLGIQPVSLHCIYDLWADNEFIEIIGSEDSLISTIPTNVSALYVNSTNKHLVIQKSTGIGYFFDENKYVYVQSIQVKKGGHKNDCYIVKDKLNVQYKICNNLNKNMTPGLLFNTQQSGGVQSAASKKLNMKLISPITSSSKSLDYQSIFSSPIQVSDTINFFKEQ